MGWGAQKQYLQNPLYHSLCSEFDDVLQRVVLKVDPEHTALKLLVHVVQGQDGFLTAQIDTAL